MGPQEQAASLSVLFLSCCKVAGCILAPPETWQAVWDLRGCQRHPKGGGAPSSFRHVAFVQHPTAPCATVPPSLVSARPPPSREATKQCLPQHGGPLAPGRGPSLRLRQQKGLEAASCSLNVLGSDSRQEGDALSKRNLGAGCFQGRNLCKTAAKVWQTGGYNSEEGRGGSWAGSRPVLRVGDGEDPGGKSHF